MKLLKSLLILSALSLPFSALCQRTKRNAPTLPTEPPKSFSQQVYDDYTEFYRNGGVFEKLYLATDKPYYSAGETLYFSGFLVNATLFTRFSDSEFIYAELISPEGRLVERVKVCADRKQFVGTFSLSPRLSEGRYTLRAYSRWQTNFDMGYFFSREIEIGNTIDDAVMPIVSYRTNDNGTVSAFVRLIDDNGLPLASTQVRYRTIVDTRSRNGSARTDDKGSIEIRFKPSDNPTDCIELNVRANNRELSRFVQMPSFSDDFDVQFCPESGNLVGGILQVVAIKAQTANGSSVAVEGKVYDDVGNFVTDIATEYKGMGRFVINASPARKYYAECTSASGLTKRFDLPAVAGSGIVVRVIRQVDGYTFFVQATPDVPIADYAAVVHSRGAVMSVVENLSHPAKLRNSDMFDGIAQVSVVNKLTRRIVAERLFYVRDGRFAEADIATDKEQFEQRDKVTLSLDVRDSEGKPAAGNFALSVTDAASVALDENAPNIFSYMLLSSDLKGEVEDPGAYFTADGKARLERLDLLMLTNGWRRYSLDAVLRHDFPRIMYPVEDSQRICGSVFGLFGRARKPSIVVMNTQTKQVEAFELNESNNFIISGLDAFSTTTYIVQALNKKGKDTTVRIKIETENYPVVTADYHREWYKDVPSTIPEAFLSRAKEKYFNDGGERVIDIDEIVVVGRKRNTPFFSTGNTGSMLNGDLSRFASVYDALSTFKELDIVGQTITTKRRYIENDIVLNEAVDNAITGDDAGNEQTALTTIASMDDDLRTPELYVNGSMSDISAIDSYDMKYVERLAFVDGRSAFMLGLSAPTGAIMMEVCPEGLSKASDTDAMARVVVRGCQKPAEFYAPKYPTLADRLGTNTDLRSTIAWEPFIRTDSLGRATVTFYTADRSGKYDVVLEGITDDGELCRAHRTISVERKPLY